MFNTKFFRNPIFLSTLFAVITISILFSIQFFWFKEGSKLYLWIGMALVSFAYLLFLASLWYKKRKYSKLQHIETESEALSTVIRPLLYEAGNRPIYLLIGNKSAGKSQFLTHSNAIKPRDKSNTIKNDFFEWYESDSAIYIKPDHRLVFQEVSSADSSLWESFINEIIRHRPRRPFSGCLLFVDFEFLIIHEKEQVDYTVNALVDRLISIGQKTAAALPVYLMMTKLDKLEGFREYVQFSPLKSNLEFLSIPLKDAKGAVANYCTDSYQNLVKVMESNALDASSHSNHVNEKQAILSFPKQFELCQNEVCALISRLNEANQGLYSLDLREVFFTSNLQGGRKYNLLAKSCSNYFNLPIIASEHTHLTETPYFTRFLMESQILPEADFAGENKTYLKLIQRRSRLAMAFSVSILLGGGDLLVTALDSNLKVIDQLVSVEDANHQTNIATSFDNQLLDVSNRIRPVYNAWIDGNIALDAEIASLNVSKLEPTTKLAYQALISKISQELMPVIERGYRIQLTQHQENLNKTLPLLKGYLMLKEPSKREITFLRKQTYSALNSLSSQPHVVDSVIEYLDAYFRTSFEPVEISMDLVRATRRSLLANSNVDLVYSQLLQQANDIDLGTLNLQRAVGFDFNTIFNDNFESKRLEIGNVYTSTGFSTFYRPNVDLLSTQVISDNWVLGLSNHVIPTKAEEESFKEEVRKKYTDDYINYWRNTLGELKVKQYNNIAELTNAIDLISGPASPMTTILRQVYVNTHFSPDANKGSLLANISPAASGAVDAISGLAEEVIKPDYLFMQRVEQAFRHLNHLQVNETSNTPTPWEEIITALNRLRTYMKDISDAPDSQMAALTAAKARMNSSESDPIIRLKQIAQKSPEPVRSWLLDIVNQSWSVMIAESSKGIQTQWYSEIYSKFREVGLNRYPFQLDAKDEISLEDFELLFASGGLLDNFIQENFAPFYDTNLWTPRRVDGEILDLSPEVLVQLRNYNVIKDTLISKSTNRFYIPFSANVLDLDSSAIRASVQVADARIDYYHGPSRIQELQWPPQSGDFNVAITIQDVTDEGKQHVLNKSGQWAVYRLLGKSTLTNTHNGSFTSDITVSGRDLSLRITPLTQRNPFTLGELFNFTIPESISL
ncbi:type VI secretion system membrane subunit TssM [Vibrio sp. ZSDE26]|uniref:Type VI secretion system membrane subunit TssM n=1 Tax=Vibrio amylolyticus TaxID=2847292 RepID=A0A9X1XI09_9VIBR|nr:type VI secretion system membrane subunit TssM [Vibrio amylolyticus]MCK6263562.1 type VI secretion system membrane subunit TssM [Vibrio amylolyticus]